MWEYILAEYKFRKNAYGETVNDGLYSIPELVDQFNKINQTAFIGITDGWLRHNDFGSCHIKTLDGMCGVLIAHKLNINSRNVNEFFPLIQFMAKKGNYTYMMMSNVARGDRIAAWKAVGFKQLFAFKNKRTLNDVELLIRPVVDETT